MGIGAGDGSKCRHGEKITGIPIAAGRCTTRAVTWCDNGFVHQECSFLWRFCGCNQKTGEAANFAAGNASGSTGKNFPAHKRKLWSSKRLCGAGPLKQRAGTRRGASGNGVRTIALWERLFLSSSNNGNRDNWQRKELTASKRKPTRWRYTFRGYEWDTTDNDKCRNSIHRTTHIAPVGQKA